MRIEIVLCFLFFFREIRDDGNFLRSILSWILWRFSILISLGSGLLLGAVHVTR